jgi:hypothetical protein
VLLILIANGMSLVRVNCCFFHAPAVQKLKEKKQVDLEWEEKRAGLLELGPKGSVCPFCPSFLRTILDVRPLPDEDGFMVAVTKLHSSCREAIEPILQIGSC